MVEENSYESEKGGSTTLSEKEIAKMIDKRIAEVLGISDEEARQLDEASTELMATPSVLSLVRATAYIHC